nr:hypothetical protein [Leptospira ilyithenensis]
MKKTRIILINIFRYHRMNNVLIITLLFSVIPFFEIFAKEISILPASLSGEVPSFLGTKEEASVELAKISRHYLKRNFFTEITDAKSVENFLSSEGFNADTKLTEQNLNLLCIEWDSNFISKDSIDFGNPVLIQTEIYNCKSKSLQQVQSKLISNFILAIEKHIEKSFRFLPPKIHDNRQKRDNIYNEVYFLFDTNASYAYYRKDFVKSVSSLIDMPNLFLGLTLVRKDKILNIASSLEHAEVKKVIEDVTWSGNNSPDVILQSIQSLKLRFTGGKKESRKLFLLLSGASKDKSNAIILALNEIRQLGFQIHIVIPNHSELTVIRELQRIGRSSSAKILGITDYQKIGNEDGYSNLYLNQFNLYTSVLDAPPPFDFVASNYKKWDASIVRAAVDVITPYNMFQAYEKISEKRVLEKSEVKTDIETLLGSEMIREESDTGRYQNALLETKGEAIWIKLPIELNVIPGKEYIVQTTFYGDSLSTWGVKNLPNETSLLRTSSSYPRSLLILPSQSKKFLESNKIKQFSGYLQGVISVVKKK